MTGRMPGGYDYEEDEWHERDYHRGYGYYQPPPRAPVAPPPRRSGDLLNPLDYGYGSSSLRRSRSTGHSPVPNIYVYNRTDVQDRDHSPARGRTQDIADRIGDLGRDIRQLSRSRGPSAHEQQLALEEKYRLREADARIARLQEDRRLEHDLVDRTRDEELIKKRYELDHLYAQIRSEQEDAKWGDREKALKSKLKLKELEEDLKRKQDEQKRKEDRDRILLEHDQKIAKAKTERERLLLEIKAKEEEEEAQQKKLIAETLAKEAEKKKKQEQADRDAVARAEQKKADEKARDDALRARFKLEEEAKKLKDKQEEEAWQLKLKMRADEEREKKKKHEKEIEDELHKKLSVFGFQENQIQAVLDPKKAADLRPGLSPMYPQQPPPVPHHTHHRASTGQIVLHDSHTPTYIKVHRDHLDIETLRYYNLRYEYDAIDPNYIVILEEISEKETELLFAHTRRYRRGGGAVLSIEDRGRGSDHQYAFVRRRRPSASPNRKKDKSPIRIGLF